MRKVEGRTFYYCSCLPGVMWGDIGSYDVHYDITHKEKRLLG